MINESAKAKIEEAAKKEYKFERSESGEVITEYVQCAYEYGAQFGYALAIDEQVNTHPTVTRLKIELLKAQSENKTLQECVEKLLQIRCDQVDVKTETLDQILALQSENARLKEKLEIAVKALDESKKSNTHTASEVSKINISTHGDLYGCDCEGGCNCKPKLWSDLEGLKYHCYGTDMQIDDALEQIKDET